MWHGHQKETQYDSEQAFGTSFISRLALKPFALIILAVFISLTGVISVSPKVNAIRDTDMSAADTAKSWAYYNSLSACIKNQDLIDTDGVIWPFAANDRINDSNAAAGKWFNNPTFGATNPTIGYFLNGLNTVTNKSSVPSSVSVNKDGKLVGDLEDCPI